MGVRSGLARQPGRVTASTGDRAAPGPSAPSRGAPPPNPSAAASRSAVRSEAAPRSAARADAASGSAARADAASGSAARADAGPRPKLLVVEDDPNIVELLSASLRFAGFDVSAVTNGAEAVAEARRSNPDLVVLDVMLPDLDGFEVIRRIRDSGVRTPVVFLTARDATEDKVRGLTLGGDDYVTKPFSLEELTARIRAVLRRTSGERSESAVLRFADLELDEESHEVRRGGTLVSLSPTEFKLLRYLMLNAGRVLSKAQILDHVWQYDFRGDDSIVESYISYLRRKVDTVEPRLIHTLRGVGYVLRLPS
jgi:two-component system OmpR family response regulator